MKILIIDDDLQFASTLKNDLIIRFSQLHDHTDIEMITENFSNIKLNHKYDFVFLDIGLPNNDGIELAKEIRKKGISSQIIFISLHQHLVHNSLVVRPFFFVRKNEYLKDLDLLFQLLEEMMGNESYISVRWQGKKYMINTYSIIYIESSNQILTIHTMNQKYYTSMNLKDLLGELNESQFVQIHKSYIINLNYLLAHTSLIVELVGKVRLNIGRNYKQQFIQKYKEFLIR